MIPTIAKKNVDLSSGSANVELGFLPDYVEITNTTMLSSMSASASDVLSVRGKPDYGSSSSQLIGMQMDASGAVTAIEMGDAVCAHKTDDYYGLSLDFSSVGGAGSSDTLSILAMRAND